MIIPEGKNRLVFKMRHLEHKNVVACTESFVGTWQAEGYELAGYVIAEKGENVMREIFPSDIPDNLQQDILTNSAGLTNTIE